MKKENRDDRPPVVALWKNIRKARGKLEKLLGQISDHWYYEDGVYRFYHQSLKVFGLQSSTLIIVEELKKLAPPDDTFPDHKSKFRFYFEEGERPKEPQILNPWFMEIVRDGTGKKFHPNDNQNWLPVTRPIVEAFMHAKYFLEMIVRYSKELDAPPNMLPSGWASVLYLYGLR